MDERFFLKLIVVCSLLGILLVYFLPSFYEPEKIQTSSVLLLPIGKFVEVSGKVSNIEESKYERSDYDNKFCLCLNPDKKSASFDLTDSTGKIKIWVDDKTKIPLPKKSDQVRITGKIQKFNGEIEIAAEKITKL